MRVVAVAVALTFSTLDAQQPARAGLTVHVAQQAMRAFPGLPVPPDRVRVTDTIDVDGEWFATVDFAGRLAHVKFRRSGDTWMPAEMANRKDWVPLAKGFAILTEFDEAGIRSTLRAIASAQFAYSAVCGSGFFAPSLAALGVPEPGQPSGFLGKDLVPPPGTTVLERDHYRITLVAPASPSSPRGCNGVPAGQSAKTWSATARREKGFSGRSYKIDVEGTLTAIH